MNRSKRVISRWSHDGIVPTQKEYEHCHAVWQRLRDMVYRCERSDKTIADLELYTSLMLDMYCAVREEIRLNKWQPTGRRAVDMGVSRVSLP